MKQKILSHLFVLILIASCGNYRKIKEFNEGFDSRILSLTNIDFETIKKEVLEPKCISCHKQYKNYPNVKSEISAIVSAINSDRMPKNSPPLSSSLKGLVQKWAEQGAPENSDGSSTTPLPELRPTWNSLSQNIIIPKCVVCHNPNGQAKFLDLTSRQTIYDHRNREFDGGTKLIDLENPKQSYLIEILKDTFEPMPPIESRIPRLKDSEIELVIEWIKQGLPN